MNKYSFKGYSGIKPAVRESLDWLFENGGLPVIKGDWYFVDPKNGTSTAGGGAENPVSSIEYAYDLCIDGAGDGIVLLSGGTTSAHTTSYLTQTLTWAKSAITVAGACAPTKIGQRARIASASVTTGAITTIAFAADTISITDSASGFVTAGFRVGQTITIDTTSNTNDGTAIITAVTAGTITCSASTFTEETAATAGSTTIVNYMSTVMNVTGDNNAFYNMSIGNYGASDADLGAVQVTGERNYFGNVHMLGAVSAVPAGETGAYNLKLNGAAECTFEGCTFGTYTVLSDGVNAGLVYDGNCLRNVFKDCDFISYSETAGHGAISSTDAASFQNVETFTGCKFINWKPGGVGALTVAVIGTAATNGHLLMHDCILLGWANWGASTVVYTTMPTAAASGVGGFATTT